MLLYDWEKMDCIAPPTYTHDTPPASQGPRATQKWFALHPRHTHTPPRPPIRGPVLRPKMVCIGQVWAGIPVCKTPARVYKLEKRHNTWTRSDLGARWCQVCNAVRKGGGLLIAEGAHHSSPHASVGLRRSLARLHPRHIHATPPAIKGPVLPPKMVCIAPPTYTHTTPPANQRPRAAAKMVCIAPPAPHSRQTAGIGVLCLAPCLAP
jgi:hypothetical protein